MFFKTITLYNQYRQVLNYPTQFMENYKSTWHVGHEGENRTSARLAQLQTFNKQVNFWENQILTIDKKLNVLLKFLLSGWNMNGSIRYCWQLFSHNIIVFGKREFNEEQLLLWDLQTSLAYDFVNYLYNQRLFYIFSTMAYVNFCQYFYFY